MMVLRPPSPFSVRSFDWLQTIAATFGNQKQSGVQGFCSLSGAHSWHSQVHPAGPQLLDPDARQPCNRPNCSAINVNVAKSSVFTILIIDADAKPRWQLTGLFRRGFQSAGALIRVCVRVQSWFFSRDVFANVV